MNRSKRALWAGPTLCPLGCSFLTGHSQAPLVLALTRAQLSFGASSLPILQLSASSEWKLHQTEEQGGAASTPLQEASTERMFSHLRMVYPSCTHALTLTGSLTHNTTVFSPSPWDFGTPSHSPGRAQPHLPAEVVAGGDVEKSPDCFACSRAAGAFQGSQAGYEQMGNRRKPNSSSHPCLPLPCPSCCQLVPWPSPAPHEKPSIKPRALQSLLPFQSLFFSFC